MVLSSLYLVRPNTERGLQGFDLYGPGMGQYAPTMGQRTVGGEVMGRGVDTYRSPDWGTTTATPYGGNRDWPITDDLRLFRGKCAAPPQRSYNNNNNNKAGGTYECWRPDARVKGSVQAE
jgi:hypothetical protein